MSRSINFALRRSGVREHICRRIVLMGVCIFLSSCQSPGPHPSPVIEFSKVPPADLGGPDRVETIAGRVTGARPGQRIVLFAKSGQWWVQPTSSQPFTVIQPDSSWKSSIHLGTEY